MKIYTNNGNIYIKGDGASLKFNGSSMYDLTNGGEFSLPDIMGSLIAGPISVALDSNGTQRARITLGVPSIAPVSPFFEHRGFSSGASEMAIGLSSATKGIGGELFIGGQAGQFDSGEPFFSGSVGLRLWTPWGAEVFDLDYEVSFADIADGFVELNGLLGQSIGAIQERQAANQEALMLAREALGIHHIDDATGVRFDNAQFGPGHFADPLALDLDGNGIETSGISNWQATTLFDHDGDGVAEGTGWLSSDDGWLVRDLNANGFIDSGGELFGNNTALADGSIAAEGFSALSALDSNSDAVIDASDATFAELGVWQDLNQDGVSQASELSSLTELGLASIDLAVADANQAQNGNRITATSTFTRTDGTSGVIANLDLAESSFYSEFNDVNVGDTSLPEMHGAGAIRNLRDAASRSTALTNILTQYSAANHDGQLALIDSLIDAWTSTSGMESMVERAEDAMLFVLYEFGNQPTLTDAEVVDAVAVIDGNGSAGGSVLGGGLSQFIADAMDSQTRADYQKWFRIISVLERFNGEEFVNFEQPTAVNPVTIVATGGYPNGSGGTVFAGYDFTRISLQQMQLDLLEQSYNALRDSVYKSLLVQTRLRPYLDAISLTMADGAISLDFDGLNAAINASFADNDVDAAWDLVELNKTAGAELGSNGWNPTLFLADYLGDNNVALGTEARAVLSGGGFAVAASHAGGLLQASAVVPHLVGLDGADVLNGTDEANDIHGGAGFDIINGLSGDDQLFGGDGHDILNGGMGADYLDGGAGADTLTSAENNSSVTEFRGGLGDDVLAGSRWNDIYHYRLGDGLDTIDEIHGYNTSFDTLVLEDINPSDTVFTREGTSLVINITDGGQVKVANWYADDRNRLQEVRFADGTAWDVDAIHHAGLEYHGTEVDETIEGLGDQPDRIYGEGGHDAINGLSGDDQLFGGEGNDTLNGGVGADHLDGGAGADTLTSAENNSSVTEFRGGLGDDVLAGSRWNDIYHYRLGDGRDTIDEIHGYNTSFDTLVLEDINPSDTVFTREGTSLVINVTDGGQVKVANWYDDDRNRLQEVRFADGTAWDVDAIHHAGLEYHGTEAGETIEGLADRPDRIYGEGGNDTLNGGVGADYLDGGAGADTLTSAENNSSVTEFRGGLGDDVLAGSRWNDIYHYRLGDGLDTIDEIHGYNTSFDTLVLEDINPSDTVFTREGTSLVINITDGGQVKVANWYADDRNRLQEVRFADGTAWDVDAIHHAGLEYHGTEVDETIEGLGDQPDRIYGEGGHDVINGLSGDDQLFGGEGNDTLNGGVGADHLGGGAGADTLTSAENNSSVTEFRGGLGDDVLAGSRWNDIYHYRLGDGRDTIDEIHGYNTSFDTLVLEDINPSDTVFTREGTSLVINVTDGGQVKVANWYDDDRNRLQEVRFADGTAWDVDAIHHAGLEYHGTDGNDVVLGLATQGHRMFGEGGDDTLTGGAGTDSLFGGLGHDTLSGLDGNDELFGGAGDDTLFGLNGDDTLYGEDGDDLIDGGAGADHLEGGAGNDEITGMNGNDVLVGGDGNDILIGLSGNDVLHGGMGNDTLDGGTGAGNLIGNAGDDSLTVHDSSSNNHFWGGLGNDTINGSRYEDTYHYYFGNGSDVIDERGGLSGKLDILKLEDLNPQDITITRDGDAFVVNVIADGAKIEVLDWYSNDSNRIEEIVFSDGTIWSIDTLHAKGLAINGTAGNDTLWGLNNANDVIYGWGGDDTLYGQGGIDTIHGGDGNDTIDGGTGYDYLGGGAGNDSLTVHDNYGGNHFWGGLGDDTMNGSRREDTYHYYLSHGRDVIDERGGYSNQDILKLENLNPEDVEVTREGTSWVVNVLSDGGRIKVEDWYSSNSNRIEQMTFADGTVWDVNTLHTKGLTINGTEEADTLWGLDNANDIIEGWGGDDTLYGQGGTDSLRGRDGNDTLDGGAGLDYLSGGAGDDYLTTHDNYGGNHFWGGRGNDTMNGSRYEDTYYYYLGNGSDVIDEQGGQSNKLDVLKLENLNPGDIEVTREGTSWVVNVLSDGGQIKVEDWYSSNSNRIEQMTFADGTVWDVNTLHAKGLTINGTEEADTLWGLDNANDIIEGWGGDDTLYGQGGTDSLRGRDGNDTLDGGAGLDYLSGGAGDDYLTTHDNYGGNHFWGGRGNDTMNGSRYEDTYHYGASGGQDIIDERGGLSGTDKLSLENLNHDQLWFERIGDDLAVSVIGTENQVKISEWYLSSANHVERFETTDGKALTNSSIDQLVAAMAAFTKPSLGETSLSAQLQQDLNPTLAAVWQSA